MRKLTEEERSKILRNETDPITLAFANSILPGESKAFFEGAEAGILSVFQILDAEKIEIPASAILLLKACANRIRA